MNKTSSIQNFNETDMNELYKFILDNANKVCERIEALKAFQVRLTGKEIVVTEEILKQAASDCGESYCPTY